MKKIFDNIISWLENHNRNVLLNHLLDGSDIVYNKILKDTGLKIPNELVELYKICQGSAIKTGDKLDDFHFFPGFYFIPIERAIFFYNNYKDDKRWNKNWFPIFANGGGDFYCVNCSDEDKSPIIEFMLDYDIEVVHESVTNMLKTIDTCYKNEIYYLDDENYLEMDYDKEEIIRKKINEYA